MTKNAVMNLLLKASDYLVVLLALVCLYAIFQIKFDFAFWIGYSDKAVAWNEIITNLSYSYLAGFIFFLLTVTLPHVKMRVKVKKALEGKVNQIATNYWACIENVVPSPKGLTRNKTKEDVVMMFKKASSLQLCRLSSVGINVSVAEYKKAKHKENKALATELLEYKSWLSSETIAQIEKIRNANLMSVVISMTNPVLQESLDNEGSRGVLASEVYDMWEVVKGIKV